MSAAVFTPARLRRYLLMTAGLALFSLGFVRIFLPVLPTTVFWLGAVLCFSKSCPALEARILAHPRFGPPIRDYRDHGVICRAGKRAALAGMLLSAVITMVLAPSDWLRLAVGVILAAVAVYIVTRPEQVLALHGEPR
ncbi:MAG: YbaN family protein [Gammaproteobacteria bacterium]